jgi:Predicted transcriptional regulators
MQTSSYRIGTVSRLTGVPAATLRVWERRYGGVQPSRTGKGVRLYSDNDVRRIALIRRAAQAGHSVGTLFELSEEELQRCVGDSPGVPAAAPKESGPPVRMVLVGAEMKARFGSNGNAVTRPGLEIVARLDSIEALEAQPIEGNVVLTEIGSLLPAMVERLCALQARQPQTRIIAVYRFAHPDALSRLGDGCVMAVRGPLDRTQLEAICERYARRPLGMSIVVPGPDCVPQRRFSDAQLAQLVSQPSGIQCQCPHHLAEILAALTAFEDYSAGCQNRDDDDAALHATLSRATARARCVMEQALECVLRHERIEL